MQEIQVSDYVKKLPLEAKQRYVQKLNAFKCNVDPYIDSFDCNSPLPPVTYAHIYDFLISSSSVHSCESQNAFKSLDAYRMVCSEGWLSTLGIKKWPNAVVLKADVKPSQRSGTLYRMWVAIKGNGAVLTAHCSCMAGLSEVCTHVGAVLYKCMQEAPQRNRQKESCTSVPCQWLPARKTVAPAELREIHFHLPQLDKCTSSISEPKRRKTCIKSSPKLPLIEPSESDKEDFFHQLSTLKHKASILSVHYKYNKPYLPVSQSMNLPSTVSSLHDKSKEQASYTELLECALLAKSTYKVGTEESTQVY